jgi:hypothetical protein
MSAVYAGFRKVARVICGCTFAYYLLSLRIFASFYTTALISECRYVYTSWVERAVRLVVYEMSTRFFNVSSVQDSTTAIIII